MNKIDFMIFIGLCAGFVLMSLLKIDLESREFFLSNVLGNNIWQMIIFGIAIFIYGKKIINSLDTNPVTKG